MKLVIIHKCNYYDFYKIRPGILVCLIFCVLSKIYKQDHLSCLWYNLHHPNITRIALLRIDKGNKNKIQSTGHLMLKKKGGWSKDGGRRNSWIMFSQSVTLKYPGHAPDPPTQNLGPRKESAFLMSPCGNSCTLATWWLQCPRVEDWVSQCCSCFINLGLCPSPQFSQGPLYQPRVCGVFLF